MPLTNISTWQSQISQDRPGGVGEFVRSRWKKKDTRGKSNASLGILCNGDLSENFLQDCSNDVLSWDIGKSLLRGTKSQYRSE